VAKKGFNPDRYLRLLGRFHRRMGFGDNLCSGYCVGVEEESLGMVDRGLENGRFPSCVCGLDFPPIENPLPKLGGLSLALLLVPSKG
jgi:hypothetical protein